MSLSIEPILSWPLVALATTGLIALVLLTYPPRVRHLPLLQRRLLLGLRTLAAILLGLAMFRPELQSSETEKRRSILYVLCDTSRSMTTPDGPGGKSRRQELLRVLEQAAGRFDGLTEEIEIRFRDFDDDLRVVEQPSDEASGDQTAIGAALEEVLQASREQRVLAVLLLSDGAQRSTASPEIDPRTVAELYGALQIPIYTVGFGGSGVTDRTVDLAVDDLLVDRLVYEKTVVPITAQIRASGAKDRRFSARVMIEDRTGRRVGESGKLRPAVPAGTSRPSVELIPSDSSEMFKAELSFVPEKPGDYKIAVEVETLDDEIRKTNNRSETVIRVTKGGIRVKYFDKLRPELKWINAVNRSDKIQLDIQVVSALGKSRTELDRLWFLPGRADVYIIGDVPAEVFGDDRLRNLAESVDAGAGLMMTGGLHSFGPGGYANSPIAGLLPVEMRAREFQGLDRVNPELYHTQRLRMLPTDDGLRHFVMTLGPAATVRERWGGLSPLRGGSKLRPRQRGLTQILAQTPEGIPLLIVHELGRSRAAAFAGHTTWQWTLVDDDWDAHLRFWNQMILWLAHKDEDTDQNMWIRIDPRNYLPGAAVEVVCGFRDESGRPITDVEPSLNLKDPDGRKHQRTLRRDGDHFSTRFENTKTPGDYWVELRVNGDPRFGLGTNSRFIVDARDAELDNPAADPALLNEVALLSGGDFLQPEGLDERRIEITRVRRMPLWDNWPVLGLFVAVLSTEWFIRKRRGLV